MRPEDFISLARYILRQEGDRPSNVSLRRALSTAYYAMFHTLAKTGVDLLIGELNTPCSKQAWRQAYRGLEHGRVKLACRNQNIMSKFPSSIQKFGNFLLKCKRFDIMRIMTPMRSLKSPLQNTSLRVASIMPKEQCRASTARTNKTVKISPPVFCYSKKRAYELSRTLWAPAKTSPPFDFFINGRDSLVCD